MRGMCAVLPVMHATARSLTLSKHLDPTHQTAHTTQCVPYSWGWGLCGQLGQGDFPSAQSRPRVITALAPGGWLLDGPLVESGWCMKEWRTVPPYSQPTIADPSIRRSNNGRNAPPRQPRGPDAGAGGQGRQCRGHPLRGGGHAGCVHAAYLFTSLKGTACLHQPVRLTQSSFSHDPQSIRLRLHVGRVELRPVGPRPGGRQPQLGPLAPPGHAAALGVSIPGGGWAVCFSISIQSVMSHLSCWYSHPVSIDAVRIGALGGRSSQLRRHAHG